MHKMWNERVAWQKVAKTGCLHPLLRLSCEKNYLKKIIITKWVTIIYSLSSKNFLIAVYNFIFLSTDSTSLSLNISVSTKRCFTLSMHFKG